MSLKSVARSLELALILGAVSAVVVGCDSTEGPDPELSGMHPRNYVESLSVPADRDTVYFMIGTSEYKGALSPAEVYSEAVPSLEGSLRMEIQVKGLVFDKARRAVVAKQWRGDTLRVWCGYDPPVGMDAQEKSSPADPVSPPWLIPGRVDIGAASGVVVRYVGPWFE